MLTGSRRAAPRDHRHRARTQAGGPAGVFLGPAPPPAGRRHKLRAGLWGTRRNFRRPGCKPRHRSLSLSATRVTAKAGGWSVTARLKAGPDGGVGFPAGSGWVKRFRDRHSLRDTDVSGAPARAAGEATAEPSGTPGELTVDASESAEPVLCVTWPLPSGHGRLRGLASTGRPGQGCAWRPFRLHVRACVTCHRGSPRDPTHGHARCTVPRPAEPWAATTAQLPSQLPC